MELHDGIDQAFSELSREGGITKETRLRLQNDLATLINILRPYRDEPSDTDAWREATPFERPEQMLYAIAEGDVVEQRPTGRRNAEPEQQRTGRQFELNVLLEAAHGMVDFAHQLGFTPRAHEDVPPVDADPV
jgi:hypothetical protein